MSYLPELVAVLLNVVLTAVIVLGAFCAFMEYSYKKHHGYLAIIAIFLSYIIDNSIVFCTEMIPDFAAVYDRMFLQTPSVKTLVFILRIASLLFLLSRSMPEFRIPHVLILSAIHASLLICVPLIQDYDLMVYFYYFPSQFVVICVAIWALNVHRKNRERYGNEEGRKLRKLLLYFLVMSILVLLEDTFVIFFVDVYTGPGIKIFNRNFNENILFCGLALLYSHRCFRDIGQMHNKILEYQTEKDDQPEFHVQMDPVRQFAQLHGLTDRETDILRCLLEGNSQQEISENLVIALGTVKTHTHNIYRKTDAANRNQIIQHYRMFLEDHE